MKRSAGTDESLRRLADWLGAGARAVVFTGAGISTESGIPDFRSPGGIWTKYRPIDFGEFVANEATRRESWRRKFATEATFAEARPNRGHEAVAELVRRGVVTTVVTQNVDGLHQASGVPDDRMVELHGNATFAKCLECHTRHELGPIREAFLRDGTLPVCERCGGIVKTATISFGQPMPAEEMRRAREASLACDLFLAVGSSLVVFPAAGFPVLAKEAGARLVIVNREPTDVDRIADVVIHDEIGAVLSGAVATLAS